MPYTERPLSSVYLSRPHNKRKLMNGRFILIYVLLRIGGSIVLIEAESHLGYRSHETGKQNLEFKILVR
jgi:hypothetical protein